MARVNHKLVKQRLNEKRSKITDKQFFSSRMLAGHFEDLAAAQTRRYHYNRRVRVNLYWKPKDAFTAATDNMQIRINTGHPLVTKVKGRENRYQLVCGMFAHELGHVLFTDFLSAQTYHNYLDSFKWYPRPPAFRLAADARNEKAFWEYVKEDPKNLQMVHQIAANIANIIEDGYIENRMLNSFPGTLGYGLETLRERHFDEIDTVTELIAKETDDGRHILESILQIMLSYAKFGRIKYGDEPKTDERIKTVFGLIDDIDEALMNRSGKERWNAVNTVMIRCWEYIQDFCEVCKERQEEAEAAGGTVTVAETLSEILSSIAGTSETGSGTSTPVPEASGNTGKSATAAARAETRFDASESESDGENASPQTESENNENASKSGEASDQPDASENAQPGGGGSGSGKQQTSESEKGRIPHQQTDGVSAPVGGSVTKNSEYQREQYDRAASDIERILDNMAEKAACEELESERIRELNEAAQSISYGDIHSDVNIRVNRIASVDPELVEQYDAICNPLICFDMVIMAPEMITVLGQSKKSIKLYILSEDWAAHGDTGHSSSIYSDPLEARARLNEALGNEIDSGCLSDWINTPEYRIEASENSYEGWLDGFYCESHYAISLEERNVVLTPSVIGDVGRDYLDASRYEDFACQVEQWEEVGKLSEEEYQRYLADKRIPNMIDKGLSDTYWECYWEAVSETAHTLLREYLDRNTHSDTDSAE